MSSVTYMAQVERYLTRLKSAELLSIEKTFIHSKVILCYSIIFYLKDIIQLFEM